MLEIMLVVNHLMMPMDLSAVNSTQTPELGSGSSCIGCRASHLQNTPNRQALSLCELVNLNAESVNPATIKAVQSVVGI